jgi:diguanylate cyclase (GGDEF)-like protein/PAS domain S-box-containing protein
MGRPTARQSIAWASAAGAGYALLGVGSLLLTHALNFTASPWPANAIFVALLCRSPVELRRSVLLGVAIGMALVSWLLVGASMEEAVGSALLAVLEVGLGAWLLTDHLKLRFPRISTWDAVRGFLLAGVLAPGVASLLGGAGAYLSLDSDFSAVAYQRWRDGVMMFAIFAPPIFFYSNHAVHRLWRPGYRLENLAFPVLTALYVYLTFRYVPFPFVPLIVPLLIAAYRQGPFGVALGGFLVAVEIIALWLAGQLPPLVGEVGTDPFLSLPLLAVVATVLVPIALSLDVVAVRAARRALATSERETAGIINQSPVGIVTVQYLSKNGVLNDAMLRMLGHETDGSREIPLDSFVEQKDLRMDRLDVMKVLSGELAFTQGKRRYRHRDGHYISAEVVASLTRHPDGTPKRWLLFVQNIEERLAQERLLASERERIRVTLETVGDGVLTTDGTGVVTYANSAAFATLGQNAATLLGTNLKDKLTLTEIETGRPARNLLATATLRGEAANRTDPVVLHTPEGVLRYVRDKVTPLLAEGGLISGWVVTFHDVSDSYRRQLEVRNRAETDALTGLANRHHFTQHVSRVYERARTMESPAALLMIDLDHFKAVNDTGGHAAGDKMLQGIAQAIQGVVRSDDLVARLGGDEFAVVLDRCSSQLSSEIAARMVTAIKNLCVTHERVTYSVGASIGVAQIAARFTAAEQWMEAADAATYRAKRAGRGRACHADDAA